MRHPVPNRAVLLRSAEGHDLLRLAAIGRDAGYPSLEVRVEATAKGFAGGNDVWIDGFALKEFAGALSAFAKSRQGRVELRSLEPGALSIVLRSTDPAGPLLVEFAIARNTPVADGPERVALRVSGAFELDPGTLDEILAGFAQLAKAVAA
jgi:hypothetical protein